MDVITLQNGKIGLEVCGMKVAIVTPSRKREHIIATNPFLPIANVFVHESELDSYAGYFHGKQLLHGSLSTHTAVGSIAKIRNAMIEATWCDEVDMLMMCDDDVLGMRYIGGRVTYEVRGWRNMMPNIMATALTAREMGAPMFGFHQSGRPQERSVMLPFEMRSWISTHTAGLFDRQLRFDPQAVSHDDIDYSLQAIAKHKYVWRDHRWYVFCVIEGHAKTEGGASSIRSKENELREVEYLREKWGDDVIVEGVGRGIGITIGVRVPKVGKNS